MLNMFTDLDLCKSTPALWPHGFHTLEGLCVGQQQDVFTYFLATYIFNPIVPAVSNTSFSNSNQVVVTPTVLPLCHLF